MGAELESSYSKGISTDGSGEADNTAPGAGAAYLFSRNGTLWQQQAYIKASNINMNDNFGYRVDLSADGTTLAISADQEDSSAVGVHTDNTSPKNNASPNSGAVYIFQINDSVWRQQAYLKASNTGQDDHFGQSISLSESGNLLAVGATWEASNAAGTSRNGEGETNNDTLGAGAVYVYSRNDTIWSQQTYVKGNNPEFIRSFGTALGLSSDGQTLAIGAGQSSSSAGSVLIY